MNKFLKIFSIIVIIIIGSIFLVDRVQVNGLYEITESENFNLEEDSLVEILDKADEIKLEKKLISFKKHYFIIVDDVVVGEVKGSFFTMFGDTLTMTDINDNVVKEEHQIKRLGLTQRQGFNISLNRVAEVTDPSGETTGYIGEEKLSDWWKFKRHQYFYDSDYKKLATAEQDRIFLCKDFTIYNNDDEVEYKIDGNFFSILNKSTIEKTDNANIDEEDVIFYTIIENSIIDSKTSESVSSSNEKRK